MYSGICACCFEPIKTGDETQIREGGRKFHEKCIKDKPNSHYVKLEKRIADKRQS